MLPMPGDFSRQSLSFPSAALGFHTVPKVAPLPSAILTLTFDPGRSMAEHTTSLAVTGSSPSCCCRQRYLLSSTNRDHTRHYRGQSPESSDGSLFIHGCVLHTSLFFANISVCLAGSWGNFRVSLYPLCVVEVSGFTNT